MYIFFPGYLIVSVREYYGLDIWTEYLEHMHIFQYVGRGVKPLTPKLPCRKSGRLNLSHTFAYSKTEKKKTICVYEPSLSHTLLKMLFLAHSRGRIIF